MSAKVIVKSGYIKNTQHMVNALAYAGHKIEAQLAVLEDGSTVTLGAEDKLLDDAQTTSIRLTLKNGKTIDLTPTQYREKVKQKDTPESEQVIVWENGEKVFNPEAYVKYIAYRPSVEKAVDRKHGLFTLDGDADIELEKQKLTQCKNCLMWSHIISLEREDAARAGYDHRGAWQTLITAKSMEIATIYNIDPKNLVVNAAYHNKDHHPHLHLYFYSIDPREGTVKDMGYASGQLRSLFFNEIFKDDVSYLKAVKNDQRGQLEARLSELMREIGGKNCRPSQEICDKLLELSVSLRDVKGKRVYAFQSPQIKAQTDELVVQMVRGDRHLSRIFDAYLATQREFVEQYNEHPEKIAARMGEFEHHFFHPQTGKAARFGQSGASDRAVLHNEVLRFAATLEQTLLSEDAPAPVPEKPPRAATTAKKEQNSEPATQGCPLEKQLETVYNKAENPSKTAQKHSIAKKRMTQSKVKYTAVLLLRSCAYQLARMAQENDRYNNHDDTPHTNITGRRNPNEVWRNYQEPIDY